MLVNGIKSNDYKTINEELNIILVCTAEEALAMDTTIIKVTTDQGDLVEQFVGFVKISATVNAVSGEVTLKCVKDNSETLTSLIKANEDSTSRLDTVDGNFVSLTSYYGDTSTQEAMTKVLNQLSMATAYMLQNQAEFSDEQTLTLSDLYPEWHTGVDYRAKQVCRYNNELYRCAQAHTSSEQNNPTVASLWTKITIDPETGYDVWQQPSGSHDAYNIGDRVLYPDAEGQVYESLINGNTWSPEAYPAGWKLIEQ